MNSWTSSASVALVAAFLLPVAGVLGAETTIRVDARGAGRPVSRYLTGACIEDVNHEIYGGIYSQMLFGESFQEPPRTDPPKGFAWPDGPWKVGDGEATGGPGSGPKLVSAAPSFADGEAGVEVFLPGNSGGNAGLIVRVANAGAGADNFDGYEISIDAARQRLLIGRHHHDFRPLKEVACDVPADRWVSLSVKLTGKTIEALVDGKGVARVEDADALPAGVVGLRPWRRVARFRHLWTTRADAPEAARADLPFEPAPSNPAAVSGMWAPVAAGTAVLEASIETDRPFTGAQSQRVTFARGAGEAGIENRGLNRQGIAFKAGKPYDGYVWLRAEMPADVFASLESGDGSHTYARTRLAVSGGEWHRYELALTPDGADAAGRFSLRLKSPGSFVVGHAFLQPGEWGRFKGLPVRRDVVEALIGQGVTVLRYGGSMVNTPEYRWKKMIGPRDRRPPYHGTWYGHSSNGWGIIDFLNLCEAVGFLAIPDFNIDESPQDMADFVEYVNGPAGSEWGRRRADDGHPAPYNLRHIELGNEEKVDEAYFRKFEPLARAIWAKDAQIIPVVGDFQYERPIADPMHVEGAASRITTLEAHGKILALARQNDREVWFDVHVWTGGPDTPSALALRSYVDAIDRLAEGARHHVAVFEFNANRHDVRRALANADAIGAVTRDGRLAVALSANGLQVDGQNDNGWDQGLLFLNPTRVWLQPPGYVTRMISRNYEPRALDARVDGGSGMLRATATRSEDGRQLVLLVVNLGPEPVTANVRLEGFVPTRAPMVEELSGPPGATNTAAEPTRIAPRRSEWRYEPKDGAADHVFPANSFTVIRFE